MRRRSLSIYLSIIITNEFELREIDAAVWGVGVKEDRGWWESRRVGEVSYTTTNLVCVWG